MINRVVMVGRMTRDPELRRTGSGAAVTSFTLALNRNYNSADGQQADYISCVVWNKVAENVAQYCSKGSLVGVEGRLRSRTYDNAQGQRVYVTEVVCDSVQFLETRAQRERNQSSMNQGMMNQKPMGQYSQPAQPQTNNFQDMQTVELESDFDNSYNIMEDDIQF
ncbi:MAG: single-stranded DNA-binding protein [Coprobacillus sp.]|nr:single-stranded DNA-binding protein [Coprobacillus sp.]